MIVVPSIAIKEGVYKSIQMTDDHFRALYSGTPFEYFLYDSAKLGQVRSFRDEFADPDHGCDGRGDQQEERQQSLQGQ